MASVETDKSARDFTSRSKDIFTLSALFVALSFLAYEILHLNFPLTFELVAISDALILGVGLALPFLFGVGPGPWKIMYIVLSFTLVEEIFLNSVYSSYGFALAFIGLVTFPTIGAVLGARSSSNKDLRIILEVSGIAFVTRIALIPFPVKILELGVSLPAIYTIIMAVVIFYLIFRNIPLDQVKLVRGTRSIPLQLSLALLGIPMGLIEYEILKPKKLVLGPNPITNEIYLVVVMVLFVGVTEELLFRGLLTNYLNKVMPQRLGIQLSSLMFALFHIGYLNPFEVIFAYAAGVLFAYLMIKTGGLTSPILVHGVDNVVLFTLPFLLPH